MTKELISRYCNLSGNNLGKSFWNPWGMYLNPEAFTEIAEDFIKAFEREFRKNDLICAIPNSGLPIAVYAHQRLKIPLIVIDFDSDDIYALPGFDNSSNKTIVIDTSSNSGGTIKNASSILNRKNISNTTFAIIVLNDLMEEKERLPFQKKLIKENRLIWLYKLSELISL